MEDQEGLLISYLIPRTGIESEPTKVNTLRAKNLRMSQLGSEKSKGLEKLSPLFQLYTCECAWRRKQTKGLKGPKGRGKRETLCVSR